MYDGLQLGLIIMKTQEVSMAQMTLFEIKSHSEQPRYDHFMIIQYVQGDVMQSLKKQHICTLKTHKMMKSQLCWGWPVISIGI